MTVLSRSLDVPLPADVLWEILVAVERWPQWMANVVEARWVDGAAPGEGAHLRFTTQHLEAAPTVDAVVTSFRPNKELAWRATAGDRPYTEGMEDVEWEWRIWGRRTGNSTVTATLTYRAEGGMPFFRELVGTRLQALNRADSSLQALRGLAEGVGRPAGEA